MGISAIDLTKQLIALQSFDDGKTFEKPVSDFLVAFAKQHLPWMEVTVQDVAPNRQNIFLCDRAPTKLLVVDQIDTVIPDQGWRTDPLVPTLSDGRIFGLGASDSKGNVAAFLAALASHGETTGLAILWYVDEECFFQGMEAYCGSELAQTIDPPHILSIDGNGTVLGLGCRGLVEFDIVLRSQSGHSANPQTSGALKPLLAVYEKFQAWLGATRDPQLGVSTSQFALLRSGWLLGEDDRGPVFGKQGNRIPNYAEAKVEIRTLPGVTYEQIEAFWKQELAACPLTEVTMRPVLDHEGFSTPRERVPAVAQALQTCVGSVPLLDPSTFGYLDVAMLARAYPHAAVCSLGIGEPGVNHKANEYIHVDQLERGVLVYRQILQNILD